MRATACGPSCTAAAPNASEVCSGWRPCTRRPHTVQHRSRQQSGARSGARPAALPDTALPRGSASRGRCSGDTPSAPERGSPHRHAPVAVGDRGAHAVPRVGARGAAAPPSAGPSRRGRPGVCLPGAPGRVRASAGRSRGAAGRARVPTGHARVSSAPGPAATDRFVVQAHRRGRSDPAHRGYARFRHIVQVKNVRYGGSDPVTSYPAITSGTRTRFSALIQNGVPSRPAWAITT